MCGTTAIVRKIGTGKKLLISTTHKKKKKLIFWDPSHCAYARPENEISSRCHNKMVFRWFVLSYRRYKTIENHINCEMLEHRVHHHRPMFSVYVNITVHVCCAILSEESLQFDGQSVFTKDWTAILFTHTFSHRRVFFLSSFVFGRGSADVTIALEHRG